MFLLILLRKKKHFLTARETNQKMKLEVDRMESTYYSPVIFGMDLREFLYEPQQLDLLPDCGWLDGGCRSLMKALKQWLGEENVQTFMLVKNPEDEHAEHVFLKVGDYFIDGDGTSNFKRMQERWIKEEHFSNVIIKPFNPDEEPSHKQSGNEPFYIEDHLVQELVQRLNERFSKDETLKLFNLVHSDPKKVKIVKSASDICWWRDSIGQVCPVLSIFRETGYIKILLTVTDKNVINDPTYQIEGYIDPRYVEIVE